MGNASLPELPGPLVVVDLGNTSATLGLVRNYRVTRLARLEGKDQRPETIAKVLRKVAGASKVSGSALASVVPGSTRMWSEAMAATCGGSPLEVTHRLRLGVPVTYPKPASIGADRLANACGGAFRYGRPLIIADFGTAVTFDVITREEGYCGGIIAPGLPLMFDYLAEKTAKLPHLKIEATRATVGKSTRQAMQLGAQWGYRGMVREILHELRRRPDLKRAKLVATGGFAGRIVEGLRPAMTVDADITLFGLACIYGLNQG
ncbi:MAG TPA: type III pantothenate kinase [Kiritimatiellia bacterium]|nr:type III pantothenate kinase [Kiritimatiellia bacterium]